VMRNGEPVGDRIGRFIRPRGHGDREIHADLERSVRGSPGYSPGEPRE
jgi:hypothetical protein